MSTRRTREKNATTRPGKIVAPVPRRSSAQVAAEKKQIALKKADAIVAQNKKIVVLAQKEREMEDDDKDAIKIPRPRPRQIKLKPTGKKVAYNSDDENGDGESSTLYFRIP
jgi:hypothetical protein